MSNNARTYIGQVHRVIESSKMKISKNPPNNIIRRIDPANLTAIQEKTPLVLGEGSFGCVQKMLYRGVEVAVKGIKGDANERDLLHEATTMQEIGDHLGVPFLDGVSIRDKLFLLII